MSIYRVQGSSIDPFWKNISISEIGISIGNPAHEGDKLDSILEWALNRFSSAMINVSDTLQLHNMLAKNKTGYEAYIKSKLSGDSWISRNESILDKYKDKVIVHRWDQWTQHSEFNGIYKDLKHFVQHSEPLQNALHNDAVCFVTRNENNTDHLNRKKLYQHSIDFILEEIACYILMGRAQRLAKIYPAKDMQSFIFMRKHDIPAELKGFENISHVRIILNKRSQYSNAA